MGGVWVVARVQLTKHQDNAGYDIINTLFFLLAPLWIRAFLYMTLGRMLWFFDDRKTLAGMSPPRFGTLFVWLDIISFIVQAAGGTISSQNDISLDTFQIGLHIYLGGIGMQEFFILCFTCLLIILHRRLLLQECRGIMMERLQNGGSNMQWW
jgi:hypothetical protein